MKEKGKKKEILVYQIEHLITNYEQTISPSHFKET